MPHRVRSNEQGDIVIPHEILKGGRPNASYEIEQDGNILRVVPVDEPGAQTVDALQAEARRLWSEGTAEERIRAFHDWLARPRPKSPPLPDEATHRESMYD